MIYRLLLFFIGLSLLACEQKANNVVTTDVCNEETFTAMEEALQTGDSQGHGPDVGSAEWMSVVEFKLGVRGDSDVPDRHTDAWCEFVNARLR